ncbi:spore germination protein, partial [Anaerosolibacter sp.]|uniref:spore germination protein n=1 Tax=Anaerosolibacter sp. TaxID=1872527 RepID=UPI0039EF1D01
TNIVKKYTGVFLLKFFKNNLASQERINDEYNLYINLTLSMDINTNISYLKTIFHNCDDIVYREMYMKQNKDNLSLLLVYCNDLVDLTIVNQNIIRPLNLFNSFNEDIHNKEFDTLEIIKETVNINVLHPVTAFKEMIDAILSGNAVLLVDRCKEAFILSCQGGKTRNIEESSVESTLRGPKDSFIENIQINASLIRMRIKSPFLKMKDFIIGSESQTTVSLFYMDNIVNKAILENVVNSLNEIEIDGIFESGYIEQYLENHPYSPFPQMLVTDRPDKVCANLLEGKIIIIVEGSPQALILPISFFQLFHSPEDYYERILFGNFIRTLRFIGFLIATSFPSIYVALISFHHELLPIDLVVDLSRSRNQVPFPPVIEALLMEITIELLREASARLPSTIGQTIGIVGAIVIGEAAISANLASPTMIIVVAVTAIGSYVLPHYSTSYSLRLIRFPIILMAATFGAFGIIIAWTWILIHLCSLDSFGYPYLSPLAPLGGELKKDALLRSTLWRFKTRPKTASKKIKKGVR